nr:MAG TPA: hypothetical protein [Caudoviricetes sp.]
MWRDIMNNDIFIAYFIGLAVAYIIWGMNN